VCGGTVGLGGVEIGLLTEREADGCVAAGWGVVVHIYYM
jgi:hypothetical protein